MATVLAWGLLNAILATCLALLVAAFSWIRPRPAVLHVLWSLVLVRLLLPSMNVWPLALPLPVIPAIAAVSSDQGVGGRVDSSKESPVSETNRTSSDADAGPARMLVETGPETAVTPVTTGPSEDRQPVRINATNASAPISRPTVSPSQPESISTTRHVTWDSFSIGIVLGFLWLTGSAPFLLIAVWRATRFSLQLHKAEPAGEEIVAIARDVAGTIGLRRLPKMVIVDGRVTPAVWPVGKLTVVLPRTLVESLDRTVLATLIAHELIHLRRRDHWIRFLELAATIGFWWLPTLYWARRRLHKVEEAACDAWVVHDWPERAADYARGLVAAAELLVRRQVGLPATGLSDLDRLQQRITTLFERTPPHRLSRPIIVATVLVGALVCGVRFQQHVRADEPKPSSRAASPAQQDAPPFRQQLAAAGPIAADQLPPACSVDDKRLSPNGRLLAFAGSFISAAGERYGLFVVDLETAELRQLSKRVIRMGFCWSPDSRHIAVGNAGGYVVNYPLTIIDVETATSDETGAFGHSPSWSPNGEEIAFVTDRNRADTMADGRIGVWNLARRELRRITPAGHDLSTQEPSASFTNGGGSPAWSPDSRKIAFLQHTAQWRGNERSQEHQLWAVNRDGTDLKLLAKNLTDWVPPITWSADGLHVQIGRSHSSFEVAQGTTLEQASWPAPPPDMQSAAERHNEGLARGHKYDVTPVLNRNRAWQKPDLKGLTNVQFLHRMSPIRLDESFSWRRDGACCVEIVAAGDERDGKQTGKLWALTGDDDRLTRDADSRYPRRATHRPDDALDDRLEHLMGTRTRFVGLDWGRHPERYSVVDARPGDAGQTILSLKPDLKHPGFRDNRNNFRIHAGAMFHFTSWAYVHDLRITQTDLLIDDATGRILQESETTEGAARTIKFENWRDLADGTSVPLRISVEIPKHKFHVEYDFQVPVEPLWILKSGKSWFEGKDPQVEEIVDLKWNVETPDVDARLSELEAALKELERPAPEQQPASHAITRFELGDIIPLRWSGVRDPLCEAIESLQFTVGPSGESNTARSRQHFQLNFQVPKPLPETPSAEPLTLVLYGREGSPLETMALPMTSLPSLGRSAEPLLQRIREHGRLWLDPDRDAAPTVTYQFHLNGNTSDHSIHDAANRNAFRGITSVTGLDSMVTAARNFYAPVQFEATFDGRRVDVAVITGPDVRREFGSGLQGSFFGGYSDGRSEQTILLTDHETGRPVLEHFTYGEVHYLDYCEPQPGQYVPKRIMFVRAGDWSLDFRFQVLDGRVWLFDHVIIPAKAERGAFVDNVRINGQEPGQREVAAKPSGEVLLFAGKRLTDRALAADATPFERHLVSFTNFQAQPEYAGLTQMHWAGARQVRVDLSRSRFNKEITGWSLSRLTSSGLAVGAGTNTATMTSPSVPAALDRTIVVEIAADDARKTRLRSSQLKKSDSGAWTATLELFSEAQSTEQWSLISGALLDADGRPLAAAKQDRTYQVHGSPYSTSEIVLDFGTLPENSPPARLMLGLNSQVVGGPVGSTWGRFYSDSSVFPIDRLLASSQPEIWRAGLSEFYRVNWTEFLRRNERRTERYRSYAAKALAPLRPHFERLFDEGKDPEGLALLCRLAGHSGDRTYEPRLLELLNHSDESVRDSAAIGLGMLRNSMGLDRIRRLASKEPGASPIANDAQLALDLLEGKGREVLE